MLIYQDLHTSSATYTFRLYPVGTDFSRIGGIYCFLIALRQAQGDGVQSATADMQSQDDERFHTPPASLEGGISLTNDVFHHAQFYSLLYVGLTNNFDYRLKNHHKISAALALGMTHIGVLKMRSSRKRKMVERDLLRSLNPPLNETFINV